MEALYQETLDRYRRFEKQYSKAVKELKRHKKKLDPLFQEAHTRVFQDIDCLACARCCRQLGPLLKENDIGRLAKINRLSKGDFISHYLYRDNEGDYVFQEMPCPFLDQSWKCLFYQSRPRACREYPHTDQKKMIKRLTSLKKDCLYCPAAVLILDKVLMQCGIPIN